MNLFTQRKPKSAMVDFGLRFSLMARITILKRTYMDDWRIINQEYFLKGVELKKIKFPEFWKESYLAKNDFYEMISEDAFDFVEKYNRGKEFLEGEKIQKFWHTHCDFCTEKITTEDSRICYCTLDYSTWICKNCFDDFCKKFDFKLQPTRNN